MHISVREISNEIKSDTKVPVCGSNGISPKGKKNAKKHIGGGASCRDAFRADFPAVKMHTHQGIPVIKYTSTLFGLCGEDLARENIPDVESFQSGRMQKRWRERKHGGESNSDRGRKCK